MDENKLRFGVGVLVISAIGIGIILTFLFGAFPTVLHRDYTLDIVFPSAQGIHAHSAVVRDGVKIGRVDDIKLLNKGGVLVSISLDAEQELTHRYVPRIGSGSFVTGDADLEFIRASDRQLAKIFKSNPDLIDQPYTDGEFFPHGDKASSLFEMQGDIVSALGAIRAAGDSISTAGENVNSLAMEVRGVIGGTDKRIDDLADEAVAALEEFQGAIRDVRKIVGDPQLNDNVQRTVAKLPELLTQAGSALQSTQDTFESFEKVGVRFEKVGVAAEETVVQARGAIDDSRQAIGSIQKAAAGADRTIENVERTFANLAEFTEPLADNGDQFVGEVLRTLDQLQSSLAQVEQFGKTLNNSDGTVKRLLEDDEIYYQIRRTVENIEMASARIRPILDDVRTFSDKIARDPRQLGVRGAITKRPNNTGFK